MNVHSMFIHSAVDTTVGTHGNFRVNASFCMGCISICTLRLIADDVESAEMVRCNACGGRGLNGYRHGEFG